MGVRDNDASLGHQLNEIPMTKAIRPVPTYT